jgi:hypothetical protein
MPNENPFVLRLMGRAGGRTSPIDGKFVVDYDPTRIGDLPAGVPDVLGHLVVTDNPADAKQFPDQTAALTYGQQPSRRGRGPGDKPLTGYSAVTQPLSNFTAGPT